MKLPYVLKPTYKMNNIYYAMKPGEIFPASSQIKKKMMRQKKPFRVY